MFILHHRSIVPVTCWATICTISVAAFCGCSPGKTSAAKSGYKPATEKPKTVPASESPSTVQKQDTSPPLEFNDSESSPSRSGESETERVEKDVRATLTAVYDSNVDVVIGYTHPKIVELLGGRESAKVEFSSLLSKMKSAGMELESLMFPSPPTFLKSEANEFVIVPTLVVISANAARVESLNYQVGNRKIGASKWTYIEGSRLNKQNVREFLPDFPEDYEFPKIYRKKL